MPTPPRPALGVAMIAAAALFFAINGTVAKLILQSGISAPHLTTLRAIGACVGLVIVGAVMRPGLSRFTITSREAPLIVVYGLAGFFGVPMLYFVAISRMPVGIALLFEYTAALFVALWVRFVRGQQVRARFWTGLALSLTGLACVAQVWSGFTLDGLGVAAGFGAAILMGAYFLLGERGVAARDSISLTGWAFGVSAVAGLASTAVLSGLPDWHALSGTTVGGTPVWLLYGYLLILGTIVPYLLIVGSLRHLPPTSVGIIGMIEPVLASGIAWVTLGAAEALNPAQLAGGALLLLGVGLAETARVAVRQNEPHVPSEPDAGAPSQRHSSPAAA